MEVSTSPLPVQSIRSTTLRCPSEVSYTQYIYLNTLIFVLPSQCLINLDSILVNEMARVLDTI